MGSSVSVSMNLTEFKYEDFKDNSKQWFIDIEDRVEISLELPAPLLE